jgi:sigma-B regulation protein RsbU (phosphoserine phosphatase)
MQSREATAGASGAAEGQGPSLPSLQGRLLLAVNGVLAVAAAAFLYLDYQDGLRSQAALRQASLAGEARTVLHALRQLGRPRREQAQGFIDAVCASMRAGQSPGHHVAARLGGEALQALAHGHASPETMSALEAAASPGREARLGGEALVVGWAEEGGDAVFVAEYLSDLREAARGRLLWRLAAVAGLAALAAAVVSLVLLRLVTWPVARLAGTVREIAAGRLGLQSDGFATAELASLSDAVNAMSRSLAEAEAERASQMAKARRVQAHLLPDLSAVRGFRAAFIYQPADSVAGDYFDIVQGSDGVLLFCIADVSGHGIAAALEAVVLKAAFLEAAERGVGPGEALAHVNARFVAASLPGDFATMLVGRWCPQSGRLEYASAGHDPAALVRAGGGRKLLGATGLPLGADPAASWRAVPVAAGRGDRLFLSTDGLPETRDASGAMFGRERLEGLLAGQAGMAGPVEQVLGEVERALLAHRAGLPVADDVTLVAIQAGDG